MGQAFDGALGSQPGPPGREAVDLFVRSYQTLLRSTGEVRVAGLVEPYLAMAPSLHPRAREPLPDAAAITYVGLRLPGCMPSVRLVLLGVSLVCFACWHFRRQLRGARPAALWVRVAAPAALVLSGLALSHAIRTGHDPQAVQQPTVRANGEALNIVGWPRLYA